MLTVIFVSKCQFKSFQKTKKVLDAYATRIGHRVWQSSITLAGLESVRHALKKQASRHTAVACHIATSTGISLRWIVGSSSKFTTSGAASIRYQTNPTENSKAETESILNWRAGYSLLRKLAYAAGIGHDLGKANSFFQEKLKKANKKIADPARHELLSLRVANKLVSDNASFSEAWKTGVEDCFPDGGDKFLAWWRKESTEPGSVSSNPSYVTQKLMTEWILATHHRLPSCEDGVPVCSNHTTDAEESSISKNKERAGEIENGVVKKYKELIVEKDTVINKRLAAPALFVTGRLALMLGDNFISSGKTLGNPTPKSLKKGAGNHSYVRQAKGKNLRANVPHNESPPYSQELSSHLLAVGWAAARSVSELVTFTRNLPGVAREDRIQLGLTGDSGTFKWQDDLYTAARTLFSRPDAKDKGFIGILCADTGTGKTRAGVLLASEMSGDDDMRLSVLLGLRTLTLQTKHQYCKGPIGLPENDVSLVMGSIPVKDLYDAYARNNDSDGKTESGTSEPEGLVPLLHKPETISFEDWLPPILDSQCESSGNKTLVVTPVLVSTVDYLVAAGDWGRKNHIIPSIRLASSDVLLDEIDSYNLEDYPALARMCFTIGLFGRKLILSSATAMPEIVKPLCDAYLTGWDSYAALWNKDTHVNFMFASDCVQAKTVCTDKLDCAMKEYESFTQDVAVNLQKKPVLRTGKIIELTRDRYEKIDEVILEQSREFHELNKLSVDGSDISVSAGLVRIAHTVEAADIAIRLASHHAELLTQNVFMKVILYHAGLPLAVRTHIENLLDHWLDRKGSKDPFLESEFVKEVKNSGCKDGFLVVVATPVEETGRDHDFDWLIKDPSSTRSLGQCVGRVRRHRRTEWTKENVGVFQYPLKHFRNEHEEDPAYCWPGFEKTYFGTHDMLDLAPNLVSNPGAHHCLLPKNKNEETLPDIERRTIEAYTEEHIRKEMTTSLFYLTNRHSLTYKFRASAGDKICFVCRNENGWELWDLNEKQEKGRPLMDKVKLRNLGPAAIKGFLIPPTQKQMDVIAQSTSEKLNVCMDTSFYIKYFSLSTRTWRFDLGPEKQNERFWFNPILGLFPPKKTQQDVVNGDT